MTPQQIKAELDADPLGLGYGPPLAAKAWEELAVLLNARTFRGPVPIAELSAYCVVQGIVATCDVVASKADTPDSLKAVCVTVTTLMRDDFRLSTADTDDPAFDGACNALIAAGLLTADQKAAMKALGANRRGRAEVLWGSPVSARQVREAGRLS